LLDAQVIDVEPGDVRRVHLLGDQFSLPQVEFGRPAGVMAVVEPPALHLR
jgi:hypothetical protein